MPRLAIILLCSVALGACALRAGDDLNYRVRHGDVLSVRVYQDPELRTEVRVAADGQIILPLVGTINAHGHTVAELHARLTAAYDRYIVAPQVVVQVTAYAPAAVQVIGQVNRPGPIALPPEKPYTLLEAIGAAGGFTRRADTRKVSLRRRADDGTQQIIEIDVDALLSRPDVNDVPVRDGDTVLVGERWI